MRRIALDLKATSHLPEKIALINKLYELGYFVLNNGAIENYYPSGYTGADKPAKALSALERLKQVILTIYLKSVILMMKSVK